MTTTDISWLSQAIAKYQMPPEAKKLLSDHPPLIICGITAAGKNTVFAEAVKLGGYQEVVSHTTRAPRHNQGKEEVDGVSYHFVNDKKISKMVQEHRFIEVKMVHRHVYGTSMEAYHNPIGVGKTPALIIDVQGIEDLVTAVPSLRPVFVLPPDFATWHARLIHRGDIAATDYISRLESAIMEIGIVTKNPAFQLVINDEVSHAARSIQAGQADRSADKLAIMNDLLQHIKSELEKLR
ncbi:MAG: hypothetical protein ABI221_03375 [Candidatus Saccharimonadales bacterium]